MTEGDRLFRSIVMDGCILFLVEFGLPFGEGIVGSSDMIAWVLAKAYTGGAGGLTLSLGITVTRSRVFRGVAGETATSGSLTRGSLTSLTSTWNCQYRRSERSTVSAKELSNE